MNVSGHVHATGYTQNAHVQTGQAPVVAQGMQVRLPRMTDHVEFDGSLKGLAAADWFNTLQISWDFNMSHAQHLQLTYVVSRPSRDAKRWYESTQVAQRSQTGTYCTAEDFKCAVYERFVLHESTKSAQEAFDKLAQNDLDVPTFDDKFHAVLHMVKIIPGGTAMEGGSAVQQYLNALRGPLERKAAELLAPWLCFRLAATTALAAHVERMLDIACPGVSNAWKRGNDDGDKTPAKRNKGCAPLDFHPCPCRTAPQCRPHMPILHRDHCPWGGTRYHLGTLARLGGG